MFNTISSDAVKSAAVAPQPEKLPDPTVDMLKTNKLIDTLDGPMSFARASSSTVINQSGDIETVGTDVPAFGIDGLACFEVVTNQYLYSEDLTQNIWDKGAGSVALSSAESALLGKNVFKYVPNTAFNIHKFAQTVTPAVGEFSQSYVIKAEGYSIIQFGSNQPAFSPISGYQLCKVDFSDGTIMSDPENTITELKDLGNGFWKITQTITIDQATSSKLTFQVYSNNDEQQWAGNGTDGLYIACPQAMQTNYAAPYIPTTNAPVTRTRDNTTIPISGNLPAAGKPFTIVCDVLYKTGEPRFMFETENSIGLGFYIKNSSFVALRGVTDYLSFTDLVTTDGINYRISCRFNVDGTFSGFLDGVKSRVSHSIDFTFDGIVSLLIGGNYTNTQNLNSYIKNFKIYNVALTDDQVAALGGPE